MELLINRDQDTGRRSNRVVKRRDDHFAVAELHAHFAVLTGEDIREVVVGFVVVLHGNLVLGLIMNRTSIIL